MRFSEQFGLGLSGGEKWFDPLLTEDTRLFVDPFLIFSDDSEQWQEALETFKHWVEKREDGKSSGTKKRAVGSLKSTYKQSSEESSFTTAEPVT